MNVMIMKVMIMTLVIFTFKNWQCEVQDFIFAMTLNQVASNKSHEGLFSHSIRLPSNLIRKTSDQWTEKTGGLYFTYKI